MKQVYIAGPLFTEGERTLLEKIDTLCTQLGFQTYLPHRDAGLFTRDKEGSKRFFLNDVAKLDAAYLVVAVLNGLDVDSGTSWEMGYGFARGKRVIGYINDTRVYQPDLQLNPMTFNSLHLLSRNITELEAILRNIQ